MSIVSCLLRLWCMSALFSFPTVISRCTPRRNKNLATIIFEESFAYRLMHRCNLITEVRFCWYSLLHTKPRHQHWITIAGSGGNLILVRKKVIIPRGARFLRGLLRTGFGEITDNSTVISRWSGESSEFQVLSFSKKLDLDAKRRLSDKMLSY